MDTPQQNTPGIIPLPSSSDQSDGAIADAAGTIPLPVPATQADAAAPQTSAAPTALPADDGDLIEKEWVEKAKQIVDRTRNDPHQQSQDLTMFKADYMQKRYGKHIKVDR